MGAPAAGKDFKDAHDDGLITRLAKFMGFDPDAPIHESYNEIAAGLILSAAGSIMGGQMFGAPGYIGGGILGGFLSRYGDDIAALVEKGTKFNLEKNFAPAAP